MTTKRRNDEHAVKQHRHDGWLDFWKVKKVNTNDNHVQFLKSQKKKEKRRADQRKV